MFLKTLFPFTLSLLVTAAHASCVMPDVSGRVGRGQNLSLNFGSNPLTVMNGTRDWLWSNQDGSGNPVALLPDGPTSGFYITVDRWTVNGHSDSVRNLAWWQANHPSWIMYKHDQLTPAYLFGDAAYVPLDISNTSVRAWMQAGDPGDSSDNKGGISHYWNGDYQAISVDNVDSVNRWDFEGICSIKPTTGCTADGGTWTQLYSGALIDSTFAGHLASWMSALKTWAGANLSSPACLWENVSYEGTDQSGTTTVAAPADLVALESGFFENCVPICGGVACANTVSANAAAWQAEIDLLNALGTGLAIYDYMTEADCWSKKNVPQNAWNFALASYLMLKKSSGDHVYWVPSLNGAVTDSSHWQDFRPEMYLQTGAPLGAMTLDAGGCYLRIFTNSVYVLINPNSVNTCSYSVGGTTYHDFDGTNYIGTLILQPLEAHVLVAGTIQTVLAR